MSEAIRRAAAILAGALAALAPLIGLAAAGHGSAAALHVNWWEWDMHAPPVGWFIVDFVVFVSALVYFTRRPIQQAFAARHATIRRAIEENEALFSQARGEFDDARDKLAAVERDVTQLIARVKEDGAAQRDRIVAAARTYAARLQEDAKGIIAHEATAARERLQKAVADSALRLGEARLLAMLSDGDRARMIDDAIGEIEQIESPAASQRRRGVMGRSAAGGDAAGGVE